MISVGHPGLREEKDKPMRGFYGTVEVGLGFFCFGVGHVLLVKIFLRGSAFLTRCSRFPQYDYVKRCVGLENFVKVKKYWDGSWSVVDAYDYLAE